MTALFTDATVFIGGPGCSMTAPCRGGATTAALVARLASVHNVFTVLGAPQVAGNLVFLRYESKSDNDPRAGVERQVIVANITVTGEKIAAFLSVPDLSDAQTLKGQLFARSQGSPAPVAADPAALLRRYQDAINRGDAGGAATLLADNAVNIAGGPPCTPTSPCTNPADSLKAAQNGVTNHQQLTLLGDPAVAIDLAQARSEVRQDSATAAGVDRFLTIGTYQAQGDKIVGRIILFDLSDAQTVKFELYIQQPR